MSDPQIATASHFKFVKAVSEVVARNVAAKLCNGTERKGSLLARLFLASAQFNAWESGYRQICEKFENDLSVMSLYLPRSLKAPLAMDKGGSASVPVVLTTPAAVVFADVSGYSKLAEMLDSTASDSGHGPESVKGILNAYFGPVMDAIVARGGDIVKVAGDAILAVWTCSSEEMLPEASRTAIAAFTEIIKEFDKFEVPIPKGTVQLSLHAGMSTGNVEFCFVGSEPSRFFIATGKPIDQSCLAAERSTCGQLVFSEETWEHVKGMGLRVTSLPPDMWLLIPGDQPTKSPRTPPCVEFDEPDWMSDMSAFQALRPFCNPALMAHLRTFWTPDVADIRLASCLFLKLERIQGDPHELASLHAAACTIGTTIAEYSGNIKEFGLDDKGTVLVAGFGIPPVSHHDDALRATLAALGLVKRLEPQGFKCCIGVTTGVVFAGSIGGHQRREFAMVGAIVNLAARLMLSALKLNVSVLCDDGTYKSSKDRVIFNTLEPVVVKGRPQPVPVYAPQGVVKSKNQATKRNAFNVDREREVVHRLLKSSLLGRTSGSSAPSVETRQAGASPLGGASPTSPLGAQSAGNGSPAFSDNSMDNGLMLLIEGDAGLGKTKMLHEVWALCSEMGVEAVIGKLPKTELEEPSAARPWQSILNLLLDSALGPEESTTPKKQTPRYAASPAVEKKLSSSKSVSRLLASTSTGLTPRGHPLVHSASTVGVAPVASPQHKVLPTIASDGATTEEVPMPTTPVAPPTPAPLPYVSPRPTDAGTLGRRLREYLEARNSKVLSGQAFKVANEMLEERMGIFGRLLGHGQEIGKPNTSELHTFGEEVARTLRWCTVDARGKTEVVFMMDNAQSMSALSWSIAHWVVQLGGVVALAVPLTIIRNEIGSKCCTALRRVAQVLPPGASALEPAPTTLLAHGHGSRSPSPAPCGPEMWGSISPMNFASGGRGFGSTGRAPAGFMVQPVTADAQSLSHVEPDTPSARTVGSQGSGSSQGSVQGSQPNVLSGHSGPIDAPPTPTGEAPDSKGEGGPRGRLTIVAPLKSRQGSLMGMSSFWESKRRLCESPQSPASAVRSANTKPWSGILNTFASLGPDAPLNGTIVLWQLAPLNQECTGRLVARILRTKYCHPTVSHFLHHRAMGNPLFTRDWTRLLAASGTIQAPKEENRDPDSTVIFAQGVNYGAIEPPNSIWAFVASKRDQLTPSAQKLLLLCSVAGHIIDPLSLATVFPFEAMGWASTQLHLRIRMLSQMFEELMGAQLIDDVDDTSDTVLSCTPGAATDASSKASRVTSAGPDSVKTPNRGPISALAAEPDFRSQDGPPTRSVLVLPDSPGMGRGTGLTPGRSPLSTTNRRVSLSSLTRPRFKFRSSLLQHTVYSQVPVSERQRLHFQYAERQFARVMAITTGKDPDQVDPATLLSPALTPALTPNAPLLSPKASSRPGNASPPLVSPQNLQHSQGPDFNVLSALLREDMAQNLLEEVAILVHHLFLSGDEEHATTIFKQLPRSRLTEFMRQEAKKEFGTCSGSEHKPPDEHWFWVHIPLLPWVRGLHDLSVTLDLDVGIEPDSPSYIQVNSTGVSPSATPRRRRRTRRIGSAASPLRRSGAASPLINSPTHARLVTMGSDVSPSHIQSRRDSLTLLTPGGPVTADAVERLLLVDVDPATQHPTASAPASGSGPPLALPPLKAPPASSTDVHAVPALTLPPRGNTLRNVRPPFVRPEHGSFSSCQDEEDPKQVSTSVGSAFGDSCNDLAELTFPDRSPEHARDISVDKDFPGTFDSRNGVSPRKPKVVQIAESRGSVCCTVS